MNDMLSEAGILQSAKWTAGALEEALEREQDLLWAFLRRQYDRGLRILEPLLADPEQYSRNRANLRAWYDSWSACGRCPGLRVCKAGNVHESPWPRHWAVRNVRVETTPVGIFLEIDWDLCDKARSPQANPRYKRDYAGQCRVLVENPTGDSPWGDVPRAPKRKDRGWAD